MSRENVDFVRSAYEALTLREVDRWIDRELPTAFEWHPFEQFPDNRVRRGPEEIKRFFEEALADWPDWKPEAQEITEAGDGGVVVRAFGQATSKHGVEGTMHFTQVWEFDGETPLRVREFLDHSKALEAAGRRE